MPKGNEQSGVPAVVEAEVAEDQQLTQSLCLCCEPPKRLLMSPNPSAPFAFCFREGGVTVVYKKEGEGYLRTGYELREDSIIDPKTNEVIFPPAEQAAAPIQERLRRETPEEPVVSGKLLEESAEQDDAWRGDLAMVGRALGGIAADGEAADAP